MPLKMSNCNGFLLKQLQFQRCNVASGVARGVLRCPDTLPPFENKFQYKFLFFLIFKFKKFICLPKMLKTTRKMNRNI